jgi:Flp pilus assembly pilin Flp
MISPLRRFSSNTSGATTIEFVVVFLGFIAMIFFVIETTLYQFSVASLEKAAQAGVRAAVTSPAVIGGVPARITKAPGGIFGYKCSDAAAQCISFGTVSCTGGACNATPFNRILAHMRGFNGRIAAENVTITYNDVGIGFAGGPTVPMVTVQIDNVAYDNGIFGLLLADATGLAVLPRRAATMTGEDLGS